RRPPARARGADRGAHDHRPHRLDDRRAGLRAGRRGAPRPLPAGLAADRGERPVPRPGSRGVPRRLPLPAAPGHRAGGGRDGAGAGALDPRLGGHPVRRGARPAADRRGDRPLQRDQPRRGGGGGGALRGGDLRLAPRRRRAGAARRRRAAPLGEDVRGVGRGRPPRGAGSARAATGKKQSTGFRVIRYGRAQPRPEPQRIHTNRTTSMRSGWYGALARSAGIVAGLALMLASPAPAQQAESRGIFPYDYAVDELPNGLRLVTVPTDDPNLVALYIVVRTGSRNEVEPGKSGYAHFFEHLMFRGSENYTPEER